MTDVTAFAIDRSVRAAVDDLLLEAGVEWAPDTRWTATVFDTFDGRLAAAGRRLMLVAGEGSGRQLVLGGPTEAQVTVPGRFLPRWGGELPEGAIRSAVAGHLGVRALLPRATVTARRAVGLVRDDQGQLINRVVLLDRLRVDGAPLSALTVLQVHQIPGARRRGRALLSGLDALYAHRSTGDHLDLALAAAGRDLRGFDTSPAPQLDPLMTSAEGFRLVLAKLADVMDATWDGVAARTDTEFLHEFRVALRRTRSTLSVGGVLLAEAEVDEARVRLGWLAAQTSPARDLDVYVMRWPKYTSGLGAEVLTDLEPLHRLLIEHLDAAYATMGEVLRAPSTRAILDDWRRLLAEVHERPGDQGHVPLDATVSQLILRAHRVLVQRGRLITPQSPAAQVHDLRKDAKRLRYLLECFGSLLPAEPQRRFVKRLKVLQDNLGEHQDAEVHVAQLAEFAHRLQLRGVGHESLLAMGRLTERIDQRRRAARQAFADRFAEYDTKATTKALNDTVDGVR